MPGGSSWSTVWKELRENLLGQPACPEHPQFPHVCTLTQQIINDIVAVSEEGITVRSHRTTHEDFIEARRFRVWWEFLQDHGTASLDTHSPANPHPWRSRIVGAILITCLPYRIRRRDSSTIELI
jgi:hypothetical protein